MTNNCSGYIIFFEIPLGLYYFSLSIYEFYVIHKYYRKNNNEEVLTFILCKAIFNVLMVPTNLINLINIKFIRFINFILGLWGTVEWRLYNGENKDDQNILFLEFIMFQFIYSMYFIIYLCKINNCKIEDVTVDSVNVFEQEESEDTNKIQMVNVINIDNNSNETILTNATPIENPIINVNANIYKENMNHNIYEY
jgi:hypothetical protein